MFENMTVGEIRTVARDAAQATLDEYWSDMEIPVDPVKIARSLGADVFTAQLGDDVTGMVIGNPDEGSSIYVDKDSGMPRKRFTVAHEIGHIVSHQGALTPGLGFVDKRSNGESGTASEIYANEFAAELLMPQQKLEEAIDQLGTSNIALASHFNVSLQSMAYRRQILGL